MSTAIKFSVLCIGGIIALFLLIWAVSGFSTFGLDADDFKFLALGGLFTCLLAVGLMAAMFYSDRSGKDDI
jgi:hypothetical protein